MNTLFPKYSRRQEGNIITMEQKLLKQVNNLILDNDKCTGCGICYDSCPEEAISIGPVGAVRRGSIEYGQSISVDEKQCSYCGVCVIMCPFGALDLKIDGESRLPIAENEGFPVYDKVAEINGEKCVQCTTCEDVCPRDAIIRDVPVFEGKDKSGLKKAQALAVNNEFKYNEDKCTYCGLCGEICAAIDVVRKPFSAESGVLDGEVKWNKDLCDGCLLCVEICPSEAIEVQRGEVAKKLGNKGSVSIDNGPCCTCRWCAVNCPTEAITVEKIFEGDIEFHAEKCPGGCSTCMDICPANAIYMPSPKSPGDMHGEIEANIAVNKDFCILCGVCVNACPGEDIIVMKRTGIKVKGKETDLFLRIKEKLLTERTSKVKESVETGEVELKKTV
ncbi:4Fe-4S binding protein [Methanomicrobium antiquum]|uniref:4Fe-4S binding protein n=1 Tax=Methanomicrobium antiquum TaxID=487686 RepID=A0AAF0FV60_9EURY|nr:4Fe-4S binding protein [Methanomicrobium antiquum]MDD3978448.1 4Fe-4S binding protein [Methanomicrobium sp.]WFN37028.1 4Fe-4S binding protein [Methanomicrobium antiquum]